jgi:tetratricopeptide (TPR) repeat protein
MPFNFDAPKSFFDKAYDCYDRALGWAAEGIAQYKHWRSLLVLLDFVIYLAFLFLFFNPFEWPFPTLLSIYPRLKQSGWYAPVFWSLIVAISVIGVIKAARARSKIAEPVELKPGAIKGLLPFGYEDAEVFSRLQREENLKECLQTLADEQFRFGALSGESGVGKTSFLQAGLWPELEKRGFRCVYVKFSGLDPFESVKRACLKHLSFAGGAPDGADFQSLLRAATGQDRTPIVLFFDQFEQFFVHRKRKKDRESFTQALAQWFAEMESLPIKILICVRGDFFDRLNELQKAMRYSLGPAQSFRLERFEPDQATEIFCYLAEKEGMEYDREFISEMTRQELADAEEGSISPVDIQVLARMIERQIRQGPRAFNRLAIQKLGGAQGLLELYLITALEPLITRSSRRAAISVLQALADLEREARAGALTIEDLRQKLGGDKATFELKDAVECLLRSDMRLISPSPENEEEKFELAHERMIPALWVVAGKQLGEANYANQLLDERVNEWLGDGRASKRLFSWSELRLINKHRRSGALGAQRHEKEEFLAASRRRLRLRFAAFSLVVLLIPSLQIGWRSNAWQTYWIKIFLYSQGFRLNDKEASIEIATALTYAGDSQMALQVLDRIGNDYSKADALNKVAETYVQLGDKDKSSDLLSDMIKMAERMGDGGKVYALGLFAETYIQLGDKGKAESLLSERIRVAEQFSDDRYKARVLSAIAGTYVRLGETIKAGALLKEAVNILERTSDDQSKANTLGAIVESYTEIGKTVKDGALLKEAVKIAKQIRDDQSKTEALSKIVRSYARLGVTMKDSAPLNEAIKAAEQIGDDLSKAKTLEAIAESYAGLGDKEKARALLEDAIKTSERISGGQSKGFALREIALSYASLGERMKDVAMLKEAVKIAERIRTNDGYSKSVALNDIARSYARLGKTMKDGAMLKESAKILERNGVDWFKAYDFGEIVHSYGGLGDKEKARALLEDAIKRVERIDSRYRANYLNAIVKSYAEIGETTKDGAMLGEAVKIAERISDDTPKFDALRSIARSYAGLGETTKDGALLGEAVKIAERISNDTYKSDLLSAIARSYAEIGETVKARSLLEEVIKVAESNSPRMSDNYDYYKAYALSETAETYVRLGDKKKARALLEDAIKTAKWIDRQDKASVFSAIILSYAKLAESSNDPALFYEAARRLIGWLRGDSDRDQLLDAILSSKLATADVSRLRLLAAYYDSEVETTRALARILMACSHPELIGKNRRVTPSARYRPFRPLPGDGARDQ